MRRASSIPQKNTETRDLDILFEASALLPDQCDENL